jgi:outer membrane receptor protein involved in Fe transport
MVQSIVTRMTLPAVLLGILFLCAVELPAGTTGKISGRVTDATTKEPLTGAAVIIMNTRLGAATDLDGYYTILNIPPERYDVQIRMIGYRPMTIRNVQVSVNTTTKVDATMQDESVTADAVVVTAQRPVVDVNATSTTATVTDKDIKALPVQELQDIVNLQAGVVDGHFRGGRDGEVQYQVNGVSVNNVYNNTSTVRIDRSLIQEVQVITGTFDAEYGQAMSGVVNTVLKSGGETFEANGEFFGGTFVYPSGGMRGLDYKFHPAEIQSFQASLNGPTGLPQTFFLVNVRRNIFNDYLWGQRLFNPTDFFVSVDTSQHGTGDGTELAVSYNKEWSGLAKITNRSLPAIEISYQALVNDINATPNPGGAWAWRYNPDGMTHQHTRSIVHGLDFTHTLSTTTFYTVSLRQNYFDYTDWAYDDFMDPRYDAAGVPKSFTEPNHIYEGIPLHGAVVGGVDFNRFQQKTNTFVAKGSVTSQVSRSHQLKFGAEYQISKMDFGTDYVLTNELDSVGVQHLARHGKELPTYPGVQTYKPISVAGYGQDVIEWNDLTIRAGLRYEYFNARAYVPSDLANPANAIPGAPESYAKPTTPKYTIAPRLGVSYPITERSSVFFSYGHFYQLPNLGDMYNNANYGRLSLLQASVPDYAPMGNPDVKPERTIQYEFGYKNAVTDFLGVSINLFYKDIRDLLGVMFVNTYTSAQYSILANMDFGNVTGFTLTLDQRRIGIVSSTIDYTWQMAQGNSSSPQETAQLAQAGLDPRPRQIPFNWDQRHTLNATIQLSQPDNYSTSVIMRYGSGQPYTPSIGLGLSNQIEPNSGRKQDVFLVDLRLEKYFTISNWQLSVFARVFNLFNTTFFNGFVFSNTGSPDYSLTPITDQNTLANPTRYYAPRRIEIGVSMNSIL